MRRQKRTSDRKWFATQENSAPSVEETKNHVCGGPSRDRKTGKLAIFLLCAWLLTILAPAGCLALEEEKCDPTKSRALVFGGGGFKGAFEAGAAYHLIVHRGCDFQDFAGVSVGAINASYLAQAKAGPNSLENLQEHGQYLVQFWSGIKGPKDVLRHRSLGLVRFFLGAESVNDFSPLRKKIHTLIDPGLLLHSGRTLTVGVVSFSDGSYREVQPTSKELLRPEQFLDYLFASALMPVYGKMPRIQEDADEKNNKNWSQFADGGLRHQTPLRSYFRPKLGLDGASVGDGSAVSSIPYHPAIEELFVIATKPYNPQADALPSPDCSKNGKGGRQVFKGLKTLERSLSVILDSSYRGDLQFALIANNLLRWRQELYAQGQDMLDESSFSKSKTAFQTLNASFPVDSFNADGAGWGFPYHLGLIVPAEEYTQTLEVTPENIRRQLHFGCLAANGVMARDFQKASMKSRCESDFPYQEQSSAKNRRP